MAVRFYIDADLLGVAKLLVTLRPDITYPGDPGGVGPDGRARPPCAIKPGDQDVDWLPKVAGSGWVILSRDRHHRSRPAERAAILDHGARVITLDGRRKLNKWGELEIIFSQWQNIEQVAPTPGPWLYTASRTTFRKFEL